MDIKLALFNVLQPNGFSQNGQENKLCKIFKTSYNLKQVPRGWYEKIHVQNSLIESTLYVKHKDNKCVQSHATLCDHDPVLQLQRQEERERGISKTASVSVIVKEAYRGRRI